jgi:ribosomal protein S27E
MTIAAQTQPPISRSPWRPGVRQTHCKRGHEFTPENTYTSPAGARSCRECGRARHAGRDQSGKYQRQARQVLVKCPGCGDGRMVMDRTARAIVTGHNSGMCIECRFPPVVKPTEEHREYWLARFTPDEIKGLAQPLFDFFGEVAA